MFQLKWLGSFVFFCLFRLWFIWLIWQNGSLIVPRQNLYTLVVCKLHCITGLSPIYKSWHVNNKYEPLEKVVDTWMLSISCGFTNAYISVVKKAPYKYIDQHILPSCHHIACFIFIWAILVGATAQSITVLYHYRFILKGSLSGKYTLISDHISFLDNTYTKANC